MGVRRAEEGGAEQRWAGFVRFFVDNKLVVLLMVALLILAGLAFAPFRWEAGALPRDPVPVDALPDISENQQIVFTKWPGRSPRDVEDQITYPLTTSLLGLPGVRSIRSSSVLGFSSIYVIFEDDVEFYWSRSRVLEKLASMPAGTLPEGVAPALGPDATALGQVFWYTLEPVDEAGDVVPGAFGLDELRSIQDWSVRYSLQAVAGVSEVASIGGFVREYQVDVDPEAMLAYDVTIGQIAGAVRSANLDVGARTIEINRAEYLVRGLDGDRRIKDEGFVPLARLGRTEVTLLDELGEHPRLAEHLGDDARASAMGARVEPDPRDAQGRRQVGLEALRDPMEGPDRLRRVGIDAERPAIAFLHLAVVLQRHHDAAAGRRRVRIGA